MHEPFAPVCSHCGQFVFCFSLDSPLAEWGYCSDEALGAGPPPEELESLEEAARRGNYAFLFHSPSGVQSLPAARRLFPEDADGCEKYRPR